MGLTNLLKRQEPQQEPFFALEISHELVKAAVWTVQDKKVFIINTGDITQVEGEDKEALLEAVNMALTTANDELDQEPNKIIFGFPEYWTDADGIVAAKKDILKYLCKKLELKPMGYVITIEALVTYLKNQQGTPPTAVFVRVSDQELMVSVVTLGKIGKREVVGRSDSIVNDLKEGLKRFSDLEQLPARIILYNGLTDFEDIKQQLLSYSWEEEFPFLHTPKIESLSSETSVEAVAIAGGKEVAMSLGLDVTSDDDEVNETKENVTESSVEDPSDDDEPVVGPDVGAPIIKEELPDGFVVGRDDSVENSTQVGDLKVEEEKPALHHKKDDEPAPAAKALGAVGGLFSKGKGLLGGLKKPKAIKSAKKEEPKILEPEPKGVKPAKEEIEETPKPKKKGSLLRFPQFKKVKRLRIGVVLAALVILLGGLAFGVYWYYLNIPEADVTIYLNPKKIDTKVTLVASTSVKEADPDKFLVPAVEKEVTVEGSDTVNTTGTKRIGETAEGKVTIYNKTDNSKTFSADTVLIGPDNLRYVLKDDVTVASSSAQETDGGATIAYGKAEASIEAGAIGEEYNTGNGVDMSFKDFDDDDYSAKVTGDVTGGTSQTINVVTKEDRLNALDALTKKLEEQAKQQIEQTTEGTVVIGNGPESDVEDYTFDAEAGDEASNLTVNAKVTVRTITAQKSDFDKVMMRAVTKNIPDTYAVSSNDLSYKISSVKEAPTKKADDDEADTADEETTDEDTEASASGEPASETEGIQSLDDVDVKDGMLVSLTVKANLLPKMDFNQLKSILAGKKPPVAEEYLKTIPEFNRVEINVNRPLPGQLGTMPVKPEKIKITLKEAQ